MLALPGNYGNKINEMLKSDAGIPTGRILTVVAAAMVDDHGRVLVQQRPPGKAMADLWEFPGGTVDPAALAPATFASEALGDRHLLLLLYTLRKWGGEPQARHATALQWVHPPALRTLAMPPADIPLIGMLEALL
jgi:8-oxo-dGTP diphosphatase